MRVKTILCRTAQETLTSVVTDGMTIAVGGFGLCGIPSELIRALHDSHATDLTVISNNMGVDGAGLGLLLESRQVRKVIASYVGENMMFADQYLNGDIEVEFNPQGTLAERLRAGGAGIAGFYTRTGVSTPVATGKPTEVFDGETYLFERSLRADLSLVHAHTADTYGNLTYRRTARNFNPLVAAAGVVTIAEVENISLEALDPEVIVTPGIYVDRVVRVLCPEKHIEQRTVRPHPAHEVGGVQ
ncbi:acetoacetyl CoA-transferase (subunit A) [Frankia canadensis]|uniref:Acetoacetyl CoA-transferase (Subunit A) n=1 Tax=Frankia canadensis TaxID=1836972 RepID=A0A2I2KIC6_9ACTN|nr:acetoacetyl CoA-transferase (subunit A) [Frankia canadensis]SOU52703.1 acetoacetyl CoA-transferase (subunit A) [Frankia canadensis]